MKDEKFIECFESGTLPSESFHHQDHVKMAWLYLRQYPLLEALGKFSENLKRFATTHGKPNLYHQTITWAYMLLINERLERSGEEQSWEKFVGANPDLFDWKNNILKTYYDDETLKSEFARKTFVFPDKPCALRDCELALAET